MNQSNDNPFIDPHNTDNTCMQISAGLAFLRWYNQLESHNDHSTPDDLVRTGQNLMLDAIDQAVRYMARMPISELDGPIVQGVA